MAVWLERWNLVLQDPSDPTPPAAGIEADRGDLDKDRGGWAILASGNYWIDSVLSLGIAVLILWSGFGIVRETLNILLEGTPPHLELSHGPIRRKRTQ